MSVCTHFPKDQNCEICQRTKITKVPRRRRISDNCEPRNNHRCAVEVQDLVTQWIQSLQCNTKKLHKKPREACKSSWNPRGNQKSFILTIPWNFAKPFVCLFVFFWKRMSETESSSVHPTTLTTQQGLHGGSPLPPHAMQECHRPPPQNLATPTKKQRTP